MADQSIQYTEEMVGAGHGTKADTLNRHSLIEHNTDGTHGALTTAAPATPTANHLYKDKMVGAWCNWSGGGAPSIDDDVNVSSITDNGVGDYTFNFATAMANATYAVAGSVVRGGMLEEVTLATGSTRLNVDDSTGTLADKNGSMIVVGEQ